MDNSFCIYCGHSLLPGTNICEGCGKLVPKPTHSENFINSTAQVDLNQNSFAGGQPIHSTPTQPPNQNPSLNDPRVKRNIVEFVNFKPKFFTLGELKDIGIAYLVIYIGFMARRLLFGDIDLIDAIFETIALIFGIFGVWLIIDKIISYAYHLYPKFIYDPERTIMSMMFAFFFIGFPPSYFRYRIWLKKLPKPNNIMKIQFISNFILVLYGYGWYFLLLNHNLPDIFLYFPFIISVSVVIGIIPFGNFKLILTWNKSLYFILISLTLILLILSFQFVFLASA